MSSCYSCGAVVLLDSAKLLSTTRPKRLRFEPWVGTPMAAHRAAIESRESANIEVWRLCCLANLNSAWNIREDSVV